MNVAKMFIFKTLCSTLKLDSDNYVQLLLYV